MTDGIKVGDKVEYRTTYVGPEPGKKYHWVPGVIVRLDPLLIRFSNKVRQTVDVATYGVFWRRAK